MQLTYFCDIMYKNESGIDKMRLLNQVNQPSDLRNLSMEELNELAQEIREVLLQKLSKHGGHFGPNLGMV